MITEEQKEILRITKVDALYEAEKMTGESYKMDKKTSSLGFALHISKVEQLNKKLEEIGDTKFSETAEDYISKVSNFGFEVAYKEPFKNRDGIEENLYILFNKDLGVVIKFDTFTQSDDGSWGEKGVPSPSVNGGSMYYNWSPNDINDRWGATSSGGFVFDQKESHITLFNSDFSEKHEIKDFPNNVNYKDFNSHAEYHDEQDKIDKKQKDLVNAAFEEGKRCVWRGNHDCREAVITNLTLLMSKGILLKKWVECPINWVLNFKEYDKDSKDWEKWNNSARKLTKERFSKMPEALRECVNNTY